MNKLAKAKANELQSNDPVSALLSSDPDLWFEQKFENHMRLHKENKTASIANVVFLIEF